MGIETFAIYFSLATAGSLVIWAGAEIISAVRKGWHKP